MALAELYRVFREGSPTISEGKMASSLPDHSPEWFRDHHVLVYRGQNVENQDRVVYMPDNEGSLKKFLRKAGDIYAKSRRR